MWRENIIETSQLVITLAEWQVDKISIWLKWLWWQDIFPDLVWKISFWALQEKITGLELDDTKKMLLLRAFYSELWLIWAVLWTVWKWGTSWFISLLEKWATVAENVKAWETALKGITELPIKQLQKILETIKPLEWKWLEEIQKSLRLTQESYQVVEEMKTLPKNSPQLTELNNRLWAIEKDIKTTRWKFWFDGVMSRDLTIKNFSPIQYSYMTTTLDDISRIVEANNKLWEAIVNGKITTIYEKFKSFKEQFRLRQIWWNTVFHIADIKEAKALSLALKDLAPWIVRTLFWRLPIILIWGSIFNQAMSWEWDWKETLLAINWFTWWYMLLNEAYVWIKDWKIDLKNTATWALWALVIWTEFCLFWKDIIKYGGIRALPLAVWNSVARIPIAAIETWAWWFAKLKWGAKLLNSIPKKWKLWLLAAVAVWILLYIWVSWEGDVKELEKQWFMKNWELDLEAIKKKWNSLGKEAQEEILKFVFVSSLREPFINKWSEFNFKLENGNFIIWVKKEFLEQNRWIIEESERYLLNVLFSLGADYFVVIKEDN
jgi:hypothetical protein